MDRLTQAQGGSYDQVSAIGNRLQRLTRDGQANYRYASSSHQLTQVDQQNFTYDAMGNLIDNGRLQFSYDDAGQLATVMQNDNEIASYTYNAQRQRTAKTTQDGQTQFFYAGANLLSELNQNNAAIRDYVWFAGKPIALISYAANGSPASLYAIHVDHLGTSQAITDQYQQVVWQAQDTPFGQATLTKAEITNPLRFAGQYYDAETQLHYNWNRYYDPALGRYISSDPIGLAGGLNTFGYVGQSPLMGVDPEGLLSVTETSTGIGCGIGGAVGSVLGGAGGGAGGLLCGPGGVVCSPAAGSVGYAAGGALGCGLGGSLGYGIGSLLDWVFNESDDAESDSNDKKLSNGEIDKLKSAGIDPHDLKPKKGGSRFDLFKDKNGNIIIKPKKGNGPGDPTGLNINDF